MRAFTRSLLLLSLVLSACATPPRTASPYLQITITADRFTPNQWRIPGGATVQIQISNQTSQEHEWVMLKDPLKENTSTIDEARVLVRIRVAPGETRSSEFRAPAAPGQYAVTCAIPGHLEKGEVGTALVVQPGY